MKKASLFPGHRHACRHAGRLGDVLRLGRRLLALALAAGLLANAAVASPTAAAEGRPVHVSIGFVTREIPRPPALSNLAWLQPPPDEGIQGARLAIDDNATTGRFLGHSFSLTEERLPPDGDIAAALARLTAAGHRLIVADLDAEGLDRLIAAVGTQDLLLFNAGASDDRFRNQDCRPFLLHTLPSRAMLADALGQYLVRKIWKDWFLVVGRGHQDGLFAEALRRAAKRFGARIVAEKTWTYEYDARRTAEGEVPVFTQVADHHVLVVADEAGVFGDYLLYRTWEPRPVAGTHGLVPAAWDRSVEQWGAAQLQNRFERKAGRWMTARDYAAWAAVRSIGEAVTRTSSASDRAIAQYIRSPAFELAAFKGLKLSYRPWDGQLRQPIPLSQPRAMVALAPMEGFLHERTALDTLGHDEPESGCRSQSGQGKSE